MSKNDLIFVFLNFQNNVVFNIPNGIMWKNEQNDFIE